MNSRTHEEYGKAAARLILTCGLAPSVEPLLREGRPDFLVACSMPDRVDEVACRLPGAGPQTVVLGHNLSSFRHFQVGDRGYRWLGDESLSVGAELVAAVGAVADAEIVEHANGLLAPLSGLLEDSPMRRALAAQPGATIGLFRFSSAGEEAAYWLAAASHWLAEGNLIGARRCIGYACHHIQDACVPHHAWGVLLYGHAAFEDALEARWHETLTELIERDMIASTLAPALRNEMADLHADNVADLCMDNGLWARRVYGEPHDLAECPGDVALRVSVRAVAATIQALKLMERSAKS